LFRSTMFLRSVNNVRGILQSSSLVTRTIPIFNRRVELGSASVRTYKVAMKKIIPSPTMVEVKKSNIKQSPLKMKFLVMLVRNTWVPDALAQLKFSPKHKAVDIAQMINRAVAIAKLNYDAIPQELYVKEIMVTKGQSQKKMRIMGRGRTGFGYKRSSHVTIRLEKIDFAAQIADARTPNQARMWSKRRAIAQKIKSGIETSMTTTAEDVVSDTSSVVS